MSNASWIAPRSVRVVFLIVSAARTAASSNAFLSIIMMSYFNNPLSWSGTLYGKEKLSIAYLIEHARIDALELIA